MQRVRKLDLMMADITGTRVVELQGWNVGAMKYLMYFVCLADFVENGCFGG